MRLGQLIAELKAAPGHLKVSIEPYQLTPTKLNSYRGYYDQLALGYEHSYRHLEVLDLLKMCEDALGRSYEGYKGGTYTMDKDTEVWIANWGMCTSVTLDRVVVNDWAVYIYGKLDEDE